MMPQPGKRQAKGEIIEGRAATEERIAKEAEVTGLCDLMAE